MALNAGGTRRQGLAKLSSGILQIAINFNSSLNGDTIEITFYEDIDNDGTFENSESFTVSDGASRIAPQNLELAQGNEVYWEAQATDDGDVTTAMDNISVELEY